MGFENLANSLTGNINAGEILNNLNIPEKLTSLVSQIDGIGSLGLEGLAGLAISFASNIGSKKSTSLCSNAPVTNPLSLLDSLGQMANNLVNTALDLASNIVNCIQGQIQGLMSGITNFISGIFDAIKGFINSVVNLADKLKNIFDELRNLGKNIFRKFLAQDDCEYILADMARCILNKLADGETLSAMERKAITAIAERDISVKEALAEQLYSEKSVSNYVKHESFLANKALAQINFF